MKKALVIVSIIFVLGFVLRVMFLPQLSLTFGYDQARDAVSSLQIAHGDLKILGPSASTPGLYHGVLYYYVLAPAYLFGKGSPLVAAAWIALINAFTVFTAFFLAYSFTKKIGAGILAAFFFAISFEATQYATWLSNPTLGIFTVPLIYFGLWNWINENKKWSLFWPILTGLALGFSIQSEIFLAYQAAPVLIWLYVFKKKVKRAQIIRFFGALILALSTMILSEVKFGFRGVGGFLSLLSSGDAIVASKGLGDFIVLFFNQIGKVFSFSSYPGNVGYGFAIVVILLLYLFKSNKNKKVIYPAFLGTWLFSHLTVVTLGGTSTPFLLVGIGPAVSVLLGVSIYQLYKNNKIIAVLLLLFVVFGNIKMIMKENPRGSTIFAIQKDLVLSKELKVIDYTYKEASGKDFSINTLTSPLWVNIVWAYLYNWYGEPRYGYVPTFHGHGQEGQIIALPSSTLPKNKSFLIIEPMAGIPMQYLPLTIGEEDSKSKLISEENFGEIRVQTRAKKTNENNN